MLEKPIRLEDLQMENWPNIILWAAPIMFLLVFIEWGISIYQKKDWYNIKDFFAASFIGFVNVGISAMIKALTLGVAIFCYNISPFQIPATWWSFLICFIGIDLVRYWAHRVSHEQRFWWATHITHHNSKKYNLSVSFRLGWTQHIKIIFFVPVMLVGFDPFVFFICHQIAVLYQFWIHTEFITKLHPAIEYIFTTPSHHRVHHACDEHYLDKNYGSTLIIWDRMFGTFMPEMNRPTYGITKPVTSYNPIYLNFHEWADIVSDLKKAKNLKVGWKILFGKPSAEVINKREALDAKKASSDKEKAPEMVMEK